MIDNALVRLKQYRAVAFRFEELMRNYKSVVATAYACPCPWLPMQKWEQGLAIFTENVVTLKVDFDVESWSLIRIRTAHDFGARGKRRDSKHE
jgi:hypothetical protein